MSTERSTAARRTPRGLRSVALSLNLRKGLGEPVQIDRAIRAGVRAAGMNLWVLMFAILIASVGLDVNSTPVIIGAMLISPLMGPIVGVGYALAMQDFALLRLALRNLAVFTAISLATSTLYFSLSPLSTAGSELLARTSPTLWDVLIAFFGGAAGIVALTRRHGSTVVPGVAIATALMPPLCTAGFSLSQQRWDWFAGALYLYAINSVFIGWATLLFVKLMRLSPAQPQGALGLSTRLLTAATVLSIMAPSVYLGWRVVSSQSYVKAAEAVVRQVTEQQQVLVLGNRVRPQEREVLVTVAGEDAPERLAERIREALEAAGHSDSHVIVRSASGRPLDVGGIKRQIQNELALQLGNQAETLKTQVNELRQQVAENRQAEVELGRIAREIEAQFPMVAPVAVASAAATEPVWIRARWQRLPATEQRRVQRWLAVRLEGRQVELVMPWGEPARRATSP